MKSRLAALQCRAAPNGVGKGLLEDRRAIGNLLARAHVGEVEGHDIDAADGETLRHAGHERMLLSGAGAVRQHE
jgi:hypothetical protein